MGAKKSGFEENMELTVPGLPPSLALEANQFDFPEHG